MSQLVIPDSCMPRILHVIHDDVLDGHPGRERTLSVAPKNIIWTTMKFDVDPDVSKLAGHPFQGAYA